MSFPYKIFVKERENDIIFTSPLKKLTNTPGALQGEEAKAIYENIINSKSGTSISTPKPQKFKKNVCTKKTVNIPQDSIFTLAQNNNTKDLELLIKNGADINARDDYGWTPLMIAACSGAVESVIMLLKSGAVTNVRDKAGNNVMLLALKNKHQNVINALKAKEIKDKTTKRPVRSKDKIYYCKLCDVSVKTSQRIHETSTIHLMKEQSKTKTFYGIPEANKGFQILMRTGWNRETGLGPDGSGRKFPVKAKQKLDRSGIGAVAAKKEQCDRNEPIAKPVSSYTREKRFERNFRLEFS